MSDEARESSERVLVHVCCATCYIGVSEELAGRGVDFEGYFYNPNIHGLLEFRKRLKACKVLGHDARLKMIFEEKYGLEEWLRAVVGREEKRCEICYEMRLGRTAEVAKRMGFTGFTTTLLASTHQQHEKVRETGERAGERAGVRFVYGDWRGLHERSQAEAKRRSLYRQQYCGCIYSENERYRDSGKELWESRDEA